MNIGPTLAPTDAPHPAKAFAERLDSIFVVLLPVIAAGLYHLARFSVPVWNRVSRTRQRLARLLALLAAGRLPRPSRPRPDGVAPRKGGPPAPYIPRRRAWLVAIIGYRAAWGMANLDALLRDPITQALLAASPPEARKSLGRTLRPLCRLLGVDLPQELSAPPRPEPASGTITARPAKPPKPAPPPLRHPIYPLRRPRLILYPDPPRKTRA